MSGAATGDGQPSPKRPPLTQQELQEIASRLNSFPSLRSIAVDMGLPFQTVIVRARPLVAAMRAAGTLKPCACGKERFHRYRCSALAEGNPRYETDYYRERRAKIIAAILRGETYTSIAAKSGLGPKSVRRYLCWLTPEQRERRKALERGRHVDTGRSAAVAFRDPTYAEIAKAMPRHLSDASRDDAISELYLAILEGQIDRQDIAAEAKRFARKSVAEWESKYAPRSLNELAFDGGRETLADMLVDLTTLEPLEYRLSA